MQLTLIAESLPCFPLLNTSQAPLLYFRALNFFIGLTISCHGTLTGITYFAKQAGTFWLDLWRKKTDETDAYILFSSEEVTTTTSEETYIAFTNQITVEPGLTVGVHATSTTGHTLGVTDNVGYKTWTKLWIGPSFNFQVGTTMLRTSDPPDFRDVYRIPALHLHIKQPGEKYVKLSLFSCNPSMFKIHGWLSIRIFSLHCDQVTISF